MTLTEWLLLIIAIPCAVVTVVAVGIAYIFLATWWGGFFYRAKCAVWPGYKEWSDKRSAAAVKRMIDSSEKDLG